MSAVVTLFSNFDIFFINHYDFTNTRIPFKCAATCICISETFLANIVSNAINIGNIIFCKCKFYFVSAFVTKCHFNVLFFLKSKSAATRVTAPKNANSKLSPNELIHR